MWTTLVTVLFFLILSVIFVYCCSLICLLTVRVLTERIDAVCRCTTRLDGKIVLVTGGNSGIGFQTALDMAKRGARVIIADVNNSDESVKTIIETTGNKNVEYRKLDLASFKSVKAFAEDINKTVDRLDILVNNAGCLTEKNYITKDGVELTMQVNYLGPFLLTSLLTEKLAKTKSRIVTVSSGLYYKGDLELQDLCGLKTSNFFMSYINSKLCTVLWTKALSRKLPENVSVFCLHPGMVVTNIFAMGSDKTVIKFLKKAMGWTIRSPYQGAQTTIHACVAPGIEKFSGAYFSNCKINSTVKIKNEDTLVEDLWNETILLLKERA